MQNGKNTFQWEFRYTFPCAMAIQLYGKFISPFLQVEMIIRNFLSYIETIKWSPQHNTQSNKLHFLQYYAKYNRKVRQRWQCWRYFILDFSINTIYCQIDRENIIRTIKGGAALCEKGKILVLNYIFQKKWIQGDLLNFKK